jgi:hypothetical protein
MNQIKTTGFKIGGSYLLCFFTGRTFCIQLIQLLPVWIPCQPVRRKNQKSGKANDGNQGNQAYLE